MKVLRTLVSKLLKQLGNKDEEEENALMEIMEAEIGNKSMQEYKQEFGEESEIEDEQFTILVSGL